MIPPKFANGDFLGQISITGRANNAEKTKIVVKRILKGPLLVT